MLRKVAGVINFRVEERNQTLVVTVDKNIPRFLAGDDQRLAQVITNLLSNAVKFTPEGGSIRLNAFLDGEDAGVYTVRIEVIDTGIGISPEQQARLFSSFEQADSGTSRKFGGTGLGLAISKRIVELMGGRIWIESELGRGSTFAFTIKAGQGHEEEPGSAAPEEISLKNASILVVEDVDINREIVLALLTPTNIAIDTAENGAAAVEAFKANPEKYGMIFMDLQMPEMDGFEATRRIRAFEKSRKEEALRQGGDETQRSVPKPVPIVAMTANVFKEDVERCLEAGMNDHVGKPLNIAEVMQKLRQYLPENPLSIPS
jgi:CheY-like chemotaxis protein